jgi:hypothetical protein
VTIDAGSSIGGFPGFTGTGLSGSYSNPGYMNGVLATFNAPTICYPVCGATEDSAFSDDSGGLLAFTSGQITNLMITPGVTLPSTWGGSQLSLSGYLAIGTPGTYDFILSSDDSSNLTIGNQSVVQIGGCCEAIDAQTTFTAAGLYPILINFQEGGGNSYLSLAANDSNGDCVLGCADGGTPVDSGLFYDSNLDAAPAPTIGGGWPAMAMLAFLAGVASIRHRRGRRVV